MFIFALWMACGERIEVWCNGNTPDFDSGDLGSSPDTSTVFERQW